MTFDPDFIEDPEYGRLYLSFPSRPWPVASRDVAARWQYWILPLTLCAHYVPSFADAIIVVPPRSYTDPLCTDLYAA